MNLYTYCLNNPIIYTDPSGHAAGSVVDYLKSKKEESSFSARKEIAKDLGIKNYTGTAAQNTKMLNMLKEQQTAKEAAEKEAAKKELAKKGKVNEVKSTIEPISKNTKIIIDGSDYEDGTSADTRELLFAARYPNAALQIGAYQYGSNNISTTAVRFATDIYLTDNKVGEGSQVNAFRHVLWQSAISNLFGASVAVKAGNSHEEHPDALNGISDYSTVLYTNLSLADEACDLLNNQIGRQIGQEYERYSAVGDLVEFTSMKTLALATLDQYHESGLWVAVEQSDGLYAIEQVKLSDKQYDAAYERLNTFDDYGRAPDNKKYRGGR